MGAKKIKAVVASASGEVPVADGEGIKRVRNELIKVSKGSPYYNHYRNCGMCGSTVGAILRESASVKNWAGTSEDFPGLEEISGDRVKSIQVRRYGCWEVPFVLPWACQG